MSLPPCSIGRLRILFWRHSIPPQKARRLGLPWRCSRRSCLRPGMIFPTWRAGGTVRLLRKGHRHLPAERLEAHNRPLRPIPAGGAAIARPPRLGQLRGDPRRLLEPGVPRWPNPRSSPQLEPEIGQRSKFCGGWYEGKKWLNRALSAGGVRECLSSARRNAPISSASECRSSKAMVRSCQCASEVALSAAKSGHRGDAGLTREVENGKGSLGTRGNLLCGCRDDDRIRACRATNEARHAGIGVPTHHKRTVTLRPPHEHRGDRALARAGFE
jgi:hypothetical protein